MRTHLLARMFSIAAASWFGAAAVSASDWNQWRGPNRDGIAADFKAPKNWTADSLAKKWTVTVGEGHSSPLIVGDRAYVFAREGDREIMRCLALADGRVHWQKSYTAPYEMNPAARGHGKGPKSTPAVVDGRVFALGINGRLSAYDAQTGAVLWRKDFASDFKSTAPVFGTATSPLVDGNNVIVHVGGDNSGALMAFDTVTGKVNWKREGDGPAYASPVIANVNGVRQLITQTQKHCVALSPTDGTLLWKIPFTTSYDQSSVTPVLAGDMILFGGIQKPVMAIKPAAAGEPTTVWETNEMPVYMSTPVVVGNTLYGMSNKQRGSLFAMDAKTGAVLWKGDGRLGENASLTDVGTALLVVSDSGELTVQQKSSPGLKELLKYRLASSPVWASPAVSGQNLLIKDATTLTLFHVLDGS